MGDDDQHKQAEPTFGRVPKKTGKTVTLKMALGKEKIESSQTVARTIYRIVLINGYQYCRPHLMASCHLCSVDNAPYNERVDEERSKLGIRLGGDDKLNSISTRCRQEVLTIFSKRNSELKSLAEKYGNNHAKTNPEAFADFKRNAIREEQEYNGNFLPEVDRLIQEGISQCAYWACQNPSAPNLRFCAGCRLVKYCCVEHQALDWEWEHKGECLIPQFLKDEYKEDRERNYNGEYDIGRQHSPELTA